jgi:hypothetical protein
MREIRQAGNQELKLKLRFWIRSKICLAMWKTKGISTWQQTRIKSWLLPSHPQSLIKTLKWARSQKQKRNPSSIRWFLKTRPSKNKSYQTKSSWTSKMPKTICFSTARSRKRTLISVGSTKITLMILMKGPVRGLSQMWKRVATSLQLWLKALKLCLNRTSHQTVCRDKQSRMQWTEPAYRDKNSLSLSTTTLSKTLFNPSSALLARAPTLNPTFSPWLQIQLWSKNSSLPVLELWRR